MFGIKQKQPTPRVSTNGIDPAIQRSGGRDDKFKVLRIIRV
jgi:hypothetical protein